jgi:hypothetical protein
MKAIHSRTETIFEYFCGGILNINVGTTYLAESEVYFIRSDYGKKLPASS